MKRENGARDRRRDRDTYHQSCLIPDVLAHLAHATRRGGRYVCVVRLLRNGSKTKFFQQPGRFQARTRFLSHAQGERVGSLPAHALHSRRERLTIHGTAHRTTWSHPPQRHVRGCGMLPSMSVQMCNLQGCVCQCRGTNGTRLPDIIASAWSHLTPNTNIRAVGQIMAAASLVWFWKAHGRHGAGNQSS